MKKKSRVLLSMLVAFVMTFAMVVPTSLTQVYAATEVTYSCGRNMDEQTVDGEPAYCVNKGREYRSTPGRNYDRSPRNTNIRVKYEWNETPTALGGSYNTALALALLGNEYDTNGNPVPENGYGGFGNNQFRSKDVTSDQPACADLLAKVLYYGYPNKTDFDKSATQEAVYWVIYQGKNGNTEGGNELVNKALNSDLPADYKLYVYVLKDEDWSANGGQAQVYWEQNVVNAKFTPKEGTTPSIKTQVKTNEITNKTGQKITDTVSYENLEVGKTYYLSGKLVNKATEEEIKCTVTPKEFSPTEANGEVDVDFTDIDASNLKDGDKIVVFEYLYADSESAKTPGEGEALAQHTELNDDKQTVTVKEEAASGTLLTTVSVDDAAADKGSPCEITIPTEGATKDVVDSIDYSGLVKGATYLVSGSLWEVEDGKTVGDAPVATASEEKVAEDTDGNWEIIFKNVKLEPNKTYVVFETAKRVKDAEGNAVEDGEEIKHENPEDLGQTIVTNEGGTPVLKVMTKVKNQYISPAKNQSVTDIVTFEGLDAEKTYTIKGVIKNQKDGSDVAAECEPLEVTADIDEAGMQFYGIDASGFKDGDKLVVFEYLYEGTIEETKDFTPGDGNEVASHEDLTDVAQTVTIVDGQIKLEKTTDVTSAKPGDVIPYTIAVTNERKVPVTVQIVDNPEAGLEFVEANKNGVFDREVGTIVWDNLEVPANGTVEVMAYFEIAKDANGKVTNRAHVFEPDNSDNVLGVYEDDSLVDVLGEYSPSEEGGNGSKPDAKGSSKKTVDTGDENPMALAVITLLLAGGAFVVMRRRRTNQ